MGKKQADKTSDSNQSLGLPFIDLKAAVEAIEELVRGPSHMFFLSRPAYLRLVGDSAGFERLYAEKRGRQYDSSTEAASALEEVRLILNIITKWGVTDRTTSVVADALRRAPGEESTPEVRRLIKDKVEFVNAKLLTEAMRRRADRLEVGGSNCLQDLNVELVTDRLDNSEDKASNQPYLRVKFRYSDGSSSVPAWFYPIFAQMGVNSNVRSLEIECDEMDLDLMIRRLQSAKDLLLLSATRKSEPKP